MRPELIAQITELQKVGGAWLGGTGSPCLHCPFCSEELCLLDLRPEREGAVWCTVKTGKTHDHCTERRHWGEGVGGVGAGSGGGGDDESEREENAGKGREGTTRGTGQKASHAQTPTHAAHAAQHPHPQQRESLRMRKRRPRAIRQSPFERCFSWDCFFFWSYNDHISQEHPSPISRENICCETFRVAGPEPQIAHQPNPVYTPGGAGVLVFFSFWVLLAFFWCSSGVLLAFDNTEERQKNARRTQKSGGFSLHTPRRRPSMTLRRCGHSPPRLFHHLLICH